MTLKEYFVWILTPENISMHESVVSFQVVTLERFIPIAQMLLLLQMLWGSQWLDACGRRLQLVLRCIMYFAHYSQAHGTWLLSSKKPPIHPILQLLGLPFSQPKNPPHGFLWMSPFHHLGLSRNVAYSMYSRFLNNIVLFNLIF